MTDDRDLMMQCLRLARRGQGRTSPNPMVGAVVVDEHGVAGSGWHRGPGHLHAERVALSEAAARSRGATLYVSLEPCTHQGRTPPCVAPIVDSGIARVVVAMEDPDPRVDGSGVEYLRSRGVQVEVGVAQEAARKLNAAYVHHRIHGRPYVTYKAALSLDGRVAAADGGSRWITGPQARRDVHRLRARSDAVCVGIGTVLADNPRLTAREVRVFRQPLRVVIDSRGRTPEKARLLSDEAPTLIVTAGLSADTEALESTGAEVINLPGEDGRVSLDLTLKVLGERGITSMLLEGGPTIAGSFANQGLIDRYLFYLAPKLLGEEAAGPIVGWTAPSIVQARGLRLESHRRLGDDLRIEALPGVQ